MRSIARKPIWQWLLVGLAVGLLLTVARWGYTVAVGREDIPWPPAAQREAELKKTLAAVRTWEELRMPRRRSGRSVQEIKWELDEIEGARLHFHFFLNSLIAGTIAGGAVGLAAGLSIRWLRPASNDT